MGLKKYLFLTFLLLFVNNVFGVTTLLDKYSQCASCSNSNPYDRWQAGSYPLAMMVNITQNIEGGSGDVLECHVNGKTDVDGNINGHILNASIWADDGSGYPKDLGEGGYAILINTTMGDAYTPGTLMNVTHTFHPTGTITAGKYHIVLLDNNQLDEAHHRFQVTEDAAGTYGTPAANEGMTYTGDAGVTWTNYRTNDMVFACYKITGSGTSNENPTITGITVPDNDHSTVNLTSILVFNVSDKEGEDTDCLLNVNGTTRVVNNTIKLNYTSTFPPYDMTTDGKYTWYISCNDSNGTTTSSTYNFFLDRTNPSITINLPSANNSEYKIYTNSLMNINISMFDAYPYILNATLYNATKTYFSTQNSTAFGNYMYLQTDWNIANLTAGNFSLKVEGSDAHTAKNWSPVYSYDIINSSSVLLHLDADNIKLSLANYGTANPTQFTFDKKTDRLTINLKFSKSIPTMDLIIEADKIDLINRPDFSGWIVINNKYWFDTEPYKATIIFNNGKRAVIRLTVNSNTVTTNSIGGLNIATTMYNLILITKPETNRFMIGYKQDNYYSLNISNKGNIYSSGTKYSLNSPNGTSWICGVSNTGTWSCGH